jgi:hypothetical protein
MDLAFPGNRILHYSRLKKPSLGLQRLNMLLLLSRQSRKHFPNTHIHRAFDRLLVKSKPLFLNAQTHFNGIDALERG